jgi:uncharacterized protein (TIGR02246 family)
MAPAWATLYASTIDALLIPSEEAMKRCFAGVLAVVVMVVSGAVLAGPAEEVAQIAAPRLQALQEGNIEAYMAAFADDAVFQSAFSAFRVEGKRAIRGHFAEVFQMYPRRLVAPRQSVTRVYNEDLVITNSYSTLYLTDRQGKTFVHPVRSSMVWARVGGQWKIVDQHGSQLPIAQ